MDATKSNGLWLLPSRGRVHTNLPTFFAAAKASGISTPGAVLINNVDYAENIDAYDSLDMPEGWTIYVCQSDTCAGKLQEGLAELCDGLDWIGALQDDLVPETQGWDLKLIEALTGWNFVSTAYDHKAPPKRFNGATAFSGDFIRAVGYLYAPGLRHFFFDDIFEDLGRLMNCWTILPDIMVRHDNALMTGANDSTVTLKNSNWLHDEPVYATWKNKDRLPAADRIGQLMVQYGVAEAQPDLSDMRILIATPAGDGRYDGLYMAALMGTVAVLRQCGAQVNFSEMKFCSDVCLARAKILGAFLRSDATHMLTIDSDMGWKPMDVPRLFAYRKDFLAVAGMRKVFPESFACQNADEHGRAMPLRQEAVTGLFEMSHIGLAFAILTREACQKIVDAHPELTFVGDDGREEHAVFEPMVRNKRYLSEDYAFVHRWRALGGVVHVDSTIPLQHVGTHVWEGNLLNHLCNLASAQQRAA